MLYEKNPKLSLYFDYPAFQVTGLINLFAFKLLSLRTAATATPTGKGTTAPA